MAVSGFGCSAQDAKTPFDESMPWGVYEKCTYSVTKYYVDGNDETPVATGTYVTEIDTAGELSTIKNSFDITYNNHDKTKAMDDSGRYALNAGLTDSYRASVECYRNTLIPNKANKTFNIAQRPLIDDKMPSKEWICDSEAADDVEDGAELFKYTFPSTVTSIYYSDPRGYAYDCDYTANKAVLTTEKASMQNNTRVYKKVKKNITPANNARFDNEQLNYVVRAISNIKSKGSAVFYLSNFYDSYINGSYVRHTINVSCAEKTKDVILKLDPRKFLLSDNEGELDVSNNSYKVACIDAGIGLTNTNTAGPQISMLITSPSVTVTQRSNSEKSKKLIVEMTYVEYSMQGAKLAYKTVYTLTDYTTSKN